MRSGVSLLVTASHRYRYLSMGWQHPFTRCSPLKTSVLYWSVANSVAGFVCANSRRLFDRISGQRFTPPPHLALAALDGVRA